MRATGIDAGAGWSEGNRGALRDVSPQAHLNVTHRLGAREGIAAKDKFTHRSGVSGRSACDLLPLPHTLTRSSGTPMATRMAVDNAWTMSGASGSLSADCQRRNYCASDSEEQLVGNIL